MSLRIGLDMDGVLADFAAAYHAVERRLFGPAGGTAAGDPEEEAEQQDEDAEGARAPRSAAAATRSGRPSKARPISG